MKRKEEMAKATLEFDLSEEESDFKCAVNGRNYQLALYEVDQKLRGWLKHGHEFKTVDDALEKVRDELHQELNNKNLSLDD